jgi:peptidoglycan/LPS O-acetylase OafA/YrhL
VLYLVFLIGLVLAEIHPGHLWPQYRHCLARVALLSSFAVKFNARLADYFSRPLSRFLGRISFPLYLLRSPLFFVHGLNAGRLAGALGSGGACLLVISIALVCVLVTMVFAPVDSLGAKGARRFCAWLMGEARV